MLRRKAEANASPTSPLQLPTDRAPSPERLQLPVPAYAADRRGVHLQTPFEADGRDLLGLLDEQWFGMVVDDDAALLPHQDAAARLYDTRNKHARTVMPTSPAMGPPPTSTTRALDVRGSASTPSTKSSNATTSSTTSIQQQAHVQEGVLGGDDAVGGAAAQKAAAQQPPELGTWAGRRRVFLEAVMANEAQQQGEEEEEDGMHDAVQHNEQGNVTTNAKPAASGVPPRPEPIPIDDEAAVVEAAWRYRFGRRWAAEQEKAFDPTYGQGAGSVEAWDEALGYLAACPADGLNLQVARTTSWDRSGGLGVSMLSTGSNGLLGESSRKEV